MKRTTTFARTLFATMLVVMALSINTFAQYGNTPIDTKNPPPPPPPGGEYCIVINETIQEPINEEKSFIDWLLGSLGI